MLISGRQLRPDICVPVIEKSCNFLRCLCIITYSNFDVWLSAELRTLRLYQVPPCPSTKARDKHKELMLRPQYPPIYNEKQMPHAPSEFSEVTVIVDNSWKVGDLVDWWSDDCYWSGKITQLLGDDKAQVIIPGACFVYN